MRDYTPTFHMYHGQKRPRTETTMKAIFKALVEWINGVHAVLFPIDVESVDENAAF